MALHFKFFRNGFTVCIIATYIAATGCGNNITHTNTEEQADSLASTDTPGNTETTTNCPVDFPIPTATKPTDVHMEALTGGELKLVDGCLVAGDHVLVWPYGYKAYRCNDTVFVHNEKDERVFRTGEMLRVGGGEGGEISSMGSGYGVNVPAGITCKGRAWIVGEVRVGKK